MSEVNVELASVAEDNMITEKAEQGYAEYSIRVKPEFILEKRSESLAPVLAPESDARGDNGNVDDRDSGERKDKRKRNRGRNKKRPRDVRIEDNHKVCSAVIRGETCPYGDSCRFTHDLKAYLATRPKDIAVQSIPTCPIFELTGSCAYGIMCRFGCSHIDMATGDNVKGEVKSIPPVVNLLPRDLQIQLRKNTYPFVCQRHKAKKIGNGKEAIAATKVQEATTSNDFSPLPTKTRKRIDFSNKVYIAPLTTVGNLPFRRVMKKFGGDITCGEMAMATNLLEGKPSEWALLKRHPSEDVFGIQLAAGYPDVFTRTMEVIEKHVSVDFVDLNLGCPLDLVCKKGSGAALMMRDNRLKESLKGITTTLTKCPITIKMRTGWDEKKPFAHELVPKIASWGFPGIAHIQVHGRSRLQRYSKEANWEYVDQTASCLSSDEHPIPVIGNGDIFSYADYEEKVEKSKNLMPCAMLGRGALIKPWLPTEIKERRQWDISASERLDLLKDFVRFGLEHWGTDQHGVNNCRRFLLEWLSFLHRYVPVGLLESSEFPQTMNQRPPKHMCGRSDLETLFMSDNCADWIKISEMLLGPVPENFRFEPKHKANSYRAQ